MMSLSVYSNKETHLQIELKIHFNNGIRRKKTHCLGGFVVRFGEADLEYAASVDLLGLLERVGLRVAFGVQDVLEPGVLFGNRFLFSSIRRENKITI